MYGIGEGAQGCLRGAGVKESAWGSAAANIFCLRRGLWRGKRMNANKKQDHGLHGMTRIIALLSMAVPIFSCLDNAKLIQKPFKTPKSSHKKNEVFSAFLKNIRP